MHSEATNMNDYLAMAVGGILTFIVPCKEDKTCFGMKDGESKDAPMKMGMQVIATHTHIICMHMYRCSYIQIYTNMYICTYVHM